MLNLIISEGVVADGLGAGLRGRLVEGAPADIAVFDPGAIAGQGTLDHPNRLAKGARHTTVNGAPTFVGGGFTGTRNGQVLRRAA